MSGHGSVNKSSTIGGRYKFYGIKLTKETATVVMILGIIGIIGTAIWLLLSIVGLITYMGYISYAESVNTQLGTTYPSLAGYGITSYIVWIVVEIILLLFLFYPMFRAGKPR